MRFLVDESCDAAVLCALRTANWDVTAVAEQCAGAPDSDVIALAAGEQRVLVTEDKDFGQLVFASGRGHCGVVLLRYPFPLAARVATTLVALVREHGESLAGSFVVVRPGGARISNPPFPM
jgi:predicted nuclease of predicted toxin-antitoxin system